MKQIEKYQMINPLRYLAAFTIAVGACMHAIGLYKNINDNHTTHWWVMIFYLFAITIYPLSVALILKNRRLGYYISLIAPPIGGLLIFTGFLFPETSLLMLIPGTYRAEITLLGFFTLISEPVATVLSAFLIENQIWNMG